MRTIAGREHSRRQARGANGDRHFGRTVLAREPGQGSGFGDGYVGSASGTPDCAHHDVAAEGAGRQEEHLAIGKMRGHGQGDLFLGKRRRRNDDQFGRANRLSDIRGEPRDYDFVSSRPVFQRQFACRHDRLELLLVPSPETDFVP